MFKHLRDLNQVKVIHELRPFLINLYNSGMILTPFRILCFFSYKIKHFIFVFQCFFSCNLCGFKLGCSQDFFWIYDELHDKYSFCYVFISCNCFFYQAFYD
jgi:hypothetical protein